MSWEEAMLAVFDDLEQQASGLHLAERDAEVADLALAEYSQVSLAARLHASLDRDVQVRLLGGRVVGGRLARVGEGWFLVVDAASEWVVLPQGAATVVGLSPRADSEDTFAVTDQLTLRSVLRRLASAGERCAVHLRDDRQLAGAIGRVGRDFFELAVGEGPGRSTQVVPTSSVAALQGRR
jgi:small nuclear ribonucleoprotein (snRNP)-like protein